jgi:hypothetical protein
MKKEKKERRKEGREEGENKNLWNNFYYSTANALSS